MSQSTAESAAALSRCEHVAPILTYADVLETLAGAAPAGGYAESKDMRRLTVREVGAALADGDQQNFFDALADKAVFVPQIAAALSKPHQSDQDRLTAACLIMVGALRDYLHDLVRTDVNALIEERAQTDRTQDPYREVGHA